MSVCGKEFYIAPYAPVGRLLKLQDGDHEQDTDQPNPTRAQQVTYPANKQVKEEVAYFELNKILKQYLKHVNVHYPAERQLQECPEERERLRALQGCI